jgi:hypothetical protein
VRSKLAHAAGDKEGGGRWSGGGAQEWCPQPDPPLEARMQGGRGSGGGARRARGWSGVATRVWGHRGGRRNDGDTIGERKEKARGDSARMRCGGGVRWGRGAWGRAHCGGWGRYVFGTHLGRKRREMVMGLLCVPANCWMFILRYTDGLCGGTCKHI